MLHHVPAGRGTGIMERGPTIHVSDLGIVISTPRPYSTRGPGRPSAATALMPLPHTGNFVGCYRDYQRGRRSFTIRNYCRPAPGQPRVF